MVFFSAAFGLLLNILFWGTGLAWLLTPRPWQRYWPLFTGVAGIALQSAVVWAGAYANLAGTQVYGRWSIAVPLALLAAAWWKRGTGGWKAWKRVGGVFAIVAIVLNGLMIPYSTSSKYLTTTSLGSCDAADYAAGARVLQEFARTDREGFIGLTEVVTVHSVDNFFDYWLKLNHFTPSAIVALNGAIFGLQPFQLISVATAVFLVLGIPLVFWLARSGLRYGPKGSLVLSAVYGLSPILWYAVAHGSMSQLLAAPAIATITWAGAVLWRSGAGWKRMAGMSGLLAIAYWLILGGYNFIVVVCFLPIASYTLGQAIWTADFRRFVRWTIGMGVPLIVVGLVAPERVLGLVERFQLFQEFDFGWKIPALSPEGWYGFIASSGLTAYSHTTRWVLSALLIGPLLLALAAGAKRGERQVFLAVCLSVPILIGYVYLLLKGRAHGTNASYDAYKLFAVFYPGLLAAFGYGLVRARTGGGTMQAMAVLAATAVLAGNAFGAYRFAQRLENPPMLVDRSLARLSRIETMPEVKSVNLMISDFWTRIWANVFLLHLPQYFPTHTYEGRLNTPLKGDWDLFGGLVTVNLPDRGSTPLLDRPYWLVNTRSPYYVRARLGEGWYDSERIPRANLRWRWSKGESSEIVIENPQSRPLNVGFRFQARSPIPRDLEIWIENKRRRKVSIGTELAWVRLPSVTVPPGTTVVQLRSNLPSQQASPTDKRMLSFAAYGIELDVKADPDPTDG